MTTYADDVHAWTFDERVAPKGAADIWRSGKLDLRLALRQARRFVLDPSFVREVVRKAGVQPSEMLARCDLANLPFDKVWIEYDNQTRVDTQWALRDSYRKMLHEPERDYGRAAFLFERRRAGDPASYRATYFAEASLAEAGTLPHQAGMVGYSLNVDGAHPFDRQIEAVIGADAMRVGALVMGMPWGYTVPEDQPGIAFAFHHELARRGIGMPEARFFAPLWRRTGFRDDGVVGRQFAQACREAMGDLRFIVTMLALINSCPIEYRHREAKGFYRRRMRNVPYLDHHTVTIVCGRRKIYNVVDHALKTEMTRRRAHPVRGFWRNVDYGTARAMPACAHEPSERDGDYALCGKCGHLLRWIDHHERGDSALGYVQHDYLVKT